MTISEKEQNQFVYDSTFPSMRKKFDSIDVRTHDIKRAFSFHKSISNSIEVLELGCYAARDYIAIKECTSHYTGIDISISAIKYAKAMYPEADFKIADFETFRSHRKYDIVFAFASLIHANYSSTEDIFENINSYTNPGAIIYISMKKSDNYTKIIKKDDFGTRTYYHYSLEEYKKIGEKYFNTIYTSQQNKNNQDRFTIVFKK